uniref:Major facilitator superfamily (MFS) profile domain-containing protein n=1 Tax=Tetradesmus obliquus TaxID=3088 RepID=A0A383VWQ0_TETOB|eukprot:jgi/Sobl393_1/4038/SZX69905.1
MIPVFLFKDPLATRSWECDGAAGAAQQAACSSAWESGDSAAFCALEPTAWRWINHDSLVARFNLVCGQAWKVQLTNSLFFVGAFAGSGIFGLLCDRWGRKLPLFLATVIITASMFGLLGATSYWAVAGLRVLCGVGAAGQIHCNFLLVTECVGPNARGRAGVGALLPFTIGEFLLVALAVALPAWNHLAIAAGAINTAGLFLFPFIPESARWLLSQGKQQQATELLQAIAAANGSHMPQQPLVCSKETTGPSDTASHCSYSDSDSDTDSSRNIAGNSSSTAAGQQLGLMALLRNRSLLMRGVALLITWYALMQVYAGISLGAGGLPGSVYATFAMGTAAEVAAVLVALLLVDRVGRHNVVSIGLLLGGGACLACAVVPGTTVVAALAAIGKFGCSASQSVICIYTAELFPTSVRSTAVGICSQACRLGAIAAPFMLMLGSSLRLVSPVFLPYLVFGAISCLAGLLVLLLPETLGAAMPETMADLEQLQSFFSAQPWRHGCTGILTFMFRTRAATATVVTAASAAGKYAADSVPVIVVATTSRGSSQDALSDDSLSTGSEYNRTKYSKPADAAAADSHDDDVSVAGGHIDIEQP